MDDLSFEEFEIEYKFLKAVIEGGVETKPENILIYATSNRRHLIKETWNDRSDVQVDNGIHKSDTMEEKLSLVNRFGVTINYSKPSQKEYFEIAIQLCRRLGVELSDDEIKAEANKWELSHGGISGRTAQQFANYLAGQEKNKKSACIVSDIVIIYSLSRDIGPSPNGKALDSDSSIFKVRILVGQFKPHD